MAGYALDTFPDVFDGSLPECDAAGALPAGDYAPTRTEFEDRFVRFGDREQRQAVYAGWNRHRDALLLAGLPSTSHQLLDGSYTTSKPAPNDMDIAVEVPMESARLELLDRDHPVVRLLQGPLTSVEFLCDAYPIFRLPPDDPRYESVTARAIRYWTKWFGHSRDNAPKGRVWATVGGLR